MHQGLEDPESLGDLADPGGPGGPGDLKSRSS